MRFENGCFKKGLILTFLILYTFLASGEKAIVFEDLLKPEKIFTDGENIYISEEEIIKVFSLKSTKKLYQLTKRGEGPGEFKYSPKLTFLTEYIVATGNGKVVFYQKDGKIINEKKVPSNMRMFPVKHNYIGSRQEMDKKLRKYVRKDSIYNEDFQKLIEINSTVDENTIVINTRGKTPKQNRYMIPNGKGFITDGNDICLYDSNRGFYIEIYDHKGNKTSTINKDYPMVKVSNAYKKSKMDNLKQTKGWEQLKMMFNFVFPEYFPAFRRIFISEGLLYILTDTTEDKMWSLVVMDFTGKVLTKQTAPKMDCLYFYKGKMYYFTESEDETWVLKIRQLL